VSEKRSNLKPGTNWK